jgi:hypothetical protein
MIPSRSYKLIALIMMGLLTLIGFFWISTRKAPLQRSSTPLNESTDHL